MKKIRVLQMPMNNTRDGVTHYALENWRFIDKERFVFDFVTMAPHLDFEDKVKAEGCEVFHLSCRSTEDEARFRREVRAILDRGYDAVHLHTSWWSGFIFEELAMQCRVPQVIVHSHNTGVTLSQTPLESQLALHDRIKRRFSQNWRSYATGLCACSGLAADWLFGPEIDRKEVLILKNAIDTERFVYSESVRKKHRARLGIDDCFVVGHVGRFSYQKNHEFLIRAFISLSQKQPSARLVLIGEGELLEQTKAQAQELDVFEKTLFLGIRDDVPELMQAMDVLVLPSRFEGLPIVLIEAQASGLRCLASDSITTEAKITPHVKFLPLDEEKWQDALINLGKGYERTDCSEFISDAGYSLREGIKNIKSLYSGRRGDV